MYVTWVPQQETAGMRHTSTLLTTKPTCMSCLLMRTAGLDQVSNKRDSVPTWTNRTAPFAYATGASHGPLGRVADYPR